MTSTLRMRTDISPGGWFSGEKCLRIRREKNHVVDFRQSHWVRGKSPGNVVKVKEQMAAAFFTKVVLLPWVPLSEIENYFG